MMPKIDTNEEASLLSSIPWPRHTCDLWWVEVEKYSFIIKAVQARRLLGSQTGEAHTTRLPVDRLCDQSWYFDLDATSAPMYEYKFCHLSTYEQRHLRCRPSVTDQRPLLRQKFNLGISRDPRSPVSAIRVAPRISVQSLQLPSHWIPGADQFIAPAN
jgi:hypothetical protein